MYVPERENEGEKFPGREKKGTHILSEKQSIFVFFIELLVDSNVHKIFSMFFFE
jgi:hypothetical protein